MVGRRGVLLVFGCVLSGLAFTGSGAPQAVATDCTASSPARGGSGQGVPVDPASLTTAELQDLALMAEQDGITLAEAIDAYGWHQPFSELVNDLRSRYPEGFADSAIQPQGGAVAWVAFTGTPPPAAVALIESFPQPVAVRGGAPVSQAVVADAVPEVHYAVLAREDLVTTVSSGYDDCLGAIRVEVEASTAGASLDEAELIDELLAGLPDTGVPVTIVIVDELFGGSD